MRKNRSMPTRSRSVSAFALHTSFGSGTPASTNPITARNGTVTNSPRRSRGPSTIASKGSPSGASVSSTLP
jgi:hypothetical protein